MGRITQMYDQTPCPFLNGMEIACINCRFCDKGNETCTNIEDIIAYIKTKLDYADILSTLKDAFEEGLKKAAIE